MSNQIIRPLLLLAIIVILFVVIQKLVVSDSFSEYGFYRSAALDSIAAKEPKYLGSETCGMCHDDILAMHDNGVHKGINCEVCHGAGYRHVETGEGSDITIPAGRDFCARCHNKNAGRPSNVIKQIDVREHNKEYNCIECHNPHTPLQ